MFNFGGILRQLWLLLLLSSTVLAYGHLNESKRLSSFTAHTGPVKLVGIDDRFDLFLPLSSTVQMQRAVLDLRLARSMLLLSKRSMIAVRFNETTLAQVPFLPDQPIVNAKVVIPAELWRPGFNKLTLAVTQHYADRCEDFSAPDLWSEIDLHESTLTYQTRPAIDSPELRDLSGLFSPGIGGLEHVTLFVAPEKHYAAALPTVAQALALRRDYAPLNIKRRFWDAALPKIMQAGKPLNAETIKQSAFYLDSEAVHVLIGTTEDLGALLPQKTLDTLTGPTLKLERAQRVSDRQNKTLLPGGLRLIVAGRDEKELNQAARMLAEMDDRLNPVASARLIERNVDEARPLASSRFLQAGKTYAFSALGTMDTHLQGMGTRKIRVNLPVGADYYTHESAQAQLLLDFGYGAGLGEGSILNLYLNGEYIHGLGLNQPGGAVFRGYRINLPGRKLLPGNNLLEFEFTLRSPTLSGECRTIPGNHLLAQVLGQGSGLPFV